MAYCEMISSKLRNFGSTAKASYNKSNNLTKLLRTAPKELS